MADSDFVKATILEKIPGQLEASFLIFFTLGSIKYSNTHLPLNRGHGLPLPAALTN